jgi:MFS family permease
MNPTLRHNFRHLYFDIFWYGIVAGSTLAYLAVYVARLGATSLQLGLITGGPAVVNLLMSLPAARWIEGRSLVRTVFTTALIYRIGFLLLIPLPLLFTKAEETWIILLITLFFAVPGTLIAIAFNSMFAEVVPAQYRAEVVGRRNALVSVSMATTTFLCGWLLDTVAFPLNYQILFGIGVFGAIMSSYHLWHLRPLEAALPAAEARPQPPIARPLIRGDLLRSSFGPLLFSYFCFYATQHVPIPINPLFWVQELHLSDGAIGAGNAMFYVMMVLASMALPAAIARYGNRNVLITGALLYGAYPLLIGLASDSGLFWVASVLGGVVWGLTNAGLLNRLMERVPGDDRPAHMAWHNVILNLGILGGSLLGAGLADWIGLRNGLLTAAVLRMLSGLALLLWA